MTDAVAREVLGLIALDGMAVARNALDRLARDPTAQRSLTRIPIGSERIARESCDRSACPSMQSKRAGSAYPALLWSAYQ